jgi:DNA-binding transcriptional LysR family regulator
MEQVTAASGPRARATWACGWRQARRRATCQPESLNRWPLRSQAGHEWPIVPTITASSREKLTQLALLGSGIVCLSDFMTAGDQQRGDLVQVLVRESVDVRQPIKEVYYRNTQLAARIACFLDFVAEHLSSMRWSPLWIDGSRPGVSWRRRTGRT